MAASNNSRKKKTSRKKKPKVLLSAKYVCIFCAAVVFFCALLLSVSFFLNGTPQKKDSSEPKDVAPSVLDFNLPETESPKKTENPSAQKKTKDEKPVSPPQKAEEKKEDLPQKPEIASVKPSKPDLPVQEAKPKFNIPVAQNGARLAFVIDDGGMNVENVKKYTALPFPITIAVLPRLAHTAECASQVRRDGKELMLHQPMQAKNLSINPGPGAIGPDMDSYAIQQTLEANLAELGPGVSGFNNHEGSLITEDKLKMTFIIDLAVQKGMYFLDSRTTSLSQARQAALELDAHIIERNAPFLDNAVTREEMLKEIYKGLETANKAGYAVIIGHVDKSAEILPKLLAELYPELVKKGYKFTTPSKL